MNSLACVLFLTAAIALPVDAASFSNIRLGDRDGFGYGSGASGGPTETGGSYKSANGGAVNLDGLGPLGNGDFLPDLNGNGQVQTGTRDDFDNRSSEGIGGIGFNNVASTGFLYTDISLSTSYGTSQNNNDVWNHNTQTRGAGGTFPDPNPAILTNQPGFVFDFTVLGADIANGTPLFFNLIYGDYDVAPANVRFTRKDGSTFTLGLTVQPTNSDGLIQAAFANLSFGDVFTANGPDWDGKLTVDFIANSEPYTAFDYVEISTRQIDPNIIPTPAAAWAGLVGFSCLGVMRRKRRG
jgi:hypothetical protein